MTAVGFALFAVSNCSGSGTLTLLWIRVRHDEGQSVVFAHFRNIVVAWVDQKATVFDKPVGVVEFGEVKLFD